MSFLPYLQALDLPEQLAWVYYTPFSLSAIKKYFNFKLGIYVSIFCVAGISVLKALLIAILYSFCNTKITS
jgi:hypothetical protein